MNLESPLGLSGYKIKKDGLVKIIKNLQIPEHNGTVHFA
jgi:hypothetical protein